jgi:hypothetical protein
MLTHVRDNSLFWVGLNAGSDRGGGCCSWWGGSPEVRLAMRGNNLECLRLQLPLHPDTRAPGEKRLYMSTLRSSDSCQVEACVFPAAASRSQLPRDLQADGSDHSSVSLGGLRGTEVPLMLIVPTSSCSAPDNNRRLPEVSAGSLLPTQCTIGPREGIAKGGQEHNMHHENQIDYWHA